MVSDDLTALRVFAGFSVYSPGSGGTLGISGWGCAARTLEPLAYTRASFSWIVQFVVVEILYIYLLSSC